MPNTDPNYHVLEFLAYYCNPQNIHTYAVLVEGPWGSGKTHLVTQWLKRMQRKHLYVSLNGVSNIQQIEDQFFRQLHPILSSKGMRLTGSLLKGLLKASFKVDVNGDTRDDGSVTVQLPDINLGDYFGDPKEALLVFDDLERCAIPIPQALGYINHFVEFDSFKVILIANESEIIKRRLRDEGDSAGNIQELPQCRCIKTLASILQSPHQDDDESYGKIKEKLIGRTLRIKSSVDAALPEFISLLRDVETRNYLGTKAAEIKKLYMEFGLDNLRLLQRALWDLERILGLLTPAQRDCREATDYLLSLIVVLSMELQANRISTKELMELLSTSGMHRFTRQISSQSTTPADELVERYKDVPIDGTVLQGELVLNLLQSGWLDSERLQASLNSSRFFASSTTRPAWRRLLDFYELDDSDYIVALKDVEEQFYGRKLTIFGEILHVFALRLWLSKLGVISITHDGILLECKEYISDIALTGMLAPSPPNTDSSWERTGYAGFAFVDESKEFRELANSLFEVRRAEYDKRLPERVMMLWKDFGSAPEVFATKIKDTGDVWVAEPILAGLDTAKFVEKLLGMHFAQSNLVLSALQDRYHHNGFQGPLAPERPWLEAVRKSLVEAATSGSARARIRHLVRLHLDPVLGSPNGA